MCARERAFVLGAILATACAAGEGSLTVEIGLKGEAVAERIEAPNLRNTATAGRWSPAEAGPMPELGPGPAAPEGPAGPAPGERFPHLPRPADSVGPLASPAPTSLDALAPPPAALEPVGEVLGAGQRSWDVTTDGTLVLEPLLRTDNGANMVVRLLDDAGQEVKFDGKSLLEWHRPDDVTNAPLQFQGRARAESMQRASSNDYSPREGLSYSIAVKRGQRVEVEVDGAPRPESRIGVKSDVLR